MNFYKSSLSANWLSLHHIRHWTSTDVTVVLLHRYQTSPDNLLLYDDSRYQTSDIRHQTSDITWQLAVVWPLQPSDISHHLTNACCMMTADIRHQTSNITWQLTTVDCITTADIIHQTWDTTRQLAFVRPWQTSDISSHLTTVVWQR